MRMRTPAPCLKVVHPPIVARRTLPAGSLRDDMPKEFRLFVRAVADYYAEQAFKAFLEELQTSQAQVGQSPKSGTVRRASAGPKTAVMQRPGSYKKSSPRE